MMPLPRRALFLLLALLALAGCAAPPAEPDTPGAPGSPPSAAQSPVPELSPIAADTPAPTASSAAELPRICGDVAATYDLRAELELPFTLQVAYRDAGTLEIAGWRERTAANNDPRFSRHLLNLNSGAIEPVAPPPMPPDFTPCADCDAQVLGALPDGAATLVAVQGSAESEGIWFLSPAAAPQRLVSYLPFDVIWGDTADDALLWLNYSLPEYGRELLLIYPRENARVVQPESEYLNPTYYHLAFSTRTPTVLAYPASDENPDAPAEMITFDLSSNPPQLQQRTPYPDIARIVWDNSRNDFLIIADAGDYVTVTTLAGAEEARIPLAALQQMNDNIDSIAEWRESFIGSNTFALAPDASTFAIADGRGDLTLFACPP